MIIIIAITIITLSRIDKRRQKNAVAEKELGVGRKEEGGLWWAQIVGSVCWEVDSTAFINVFKNAYRTFLPAFPIDFPADIRKSFFCGHRWLAPDLRGCTQSTSPAAPFGGWQSRWRGGVGRLAGCVRRTDRSWKVLLATCVGQGFPCDVLAHTILESCCHGRWSGGGEGDAAQLVVGASPGSSHTLKYANAANNAIRNRSWACRLKVRQESHIAFLCIGSIVSCGPLPRRARFPDSQ